MAGHDSRTARSARRRRWLVIRQTRTPVAGGSPGTPRTADQIAELDFRLELPRVAVAPVVVHRTAVDATSFARDAAESPPATAALLPRLLGRSGGLTWMLIGDSLEPSAASGREWRSFGGRLTETIRHALGRPRDVVIDQLTPGHSLSQTAVDLAAAAPRFHPELVLVSLGPHEAEAGRRGLAAFERSLLELIQLSTRHRALPILCTPPRVPTIEAEATVDQLIYAEAVRSIAAEYDLPLVDHFAHWEAAAASAKGNAGWFDATVPVPGRYGHQQLAQRIVSDLSLAPAVAAR